MTKTEMQLLESGERSVFFKREIVKRNHIFDANQSNIERMKQGLAPVGKDGGPVNLHHMKQQSNGIIVEVSDEEHKGLFQTLHRYAGKGESEVDHGNDWNTFRSAYWKERAKDF